MMDTRLVQVILWYFARRNILENLFHYDLVIFFYNIITIITLLNNSNRTNSRKKKLQMKPFVKKITLIYISSQYISKWTSEFLKKIIRLQTFFFCFFILNFLECAHLMYKIVKLFHKVSNHRMCIQTGQNMFKSSSTSMSF